MKLKNGTLVNYKIAGTNGVGRIIGIAQNEMPVVGHIYILLDVLGGNFPNAVYNYDAFVCPECFLEVIK